MTHPSIIEMVLAGRRVPNIFERSPNARGNIVEGGEQALGAWFYVECPIPFFDLAQAASRDRETWATLRAKYAKVPRERERLKAVRAWFRKVGAHKAMEAAPVLAVPTDEEEHGLLYIVDGWHRTAVWDELQGHRPIPTLVGVEQEILRGWRRRARGTFGGLGT